MSDLVNVWAEKINIPTYKIGAPDKNPMFLEKRVYQGSSGVVYPHPVIDRVFDEKEDKEYTALFLENRYLKIMVLPEIGGRVQMALDKTNGYHFVYYNQVIKPALVGLAGPWISGGIEFNWPQHHRPSTFDPLDWRIVENADGSKTVWCAEIERMFNTKGMHGFTLYPERAYLEIRVQLYNRTAEPQTFLWWANPAVHVHDDYQSVFPPDVYAVMDHGKRDVSSFPIATGTYYKVNYAPGTDISRYKNIPVPTSYMAYHSEFDFLGDYDHRAQAGMLHIANHQIVPGKKQWTWGNGEFGKAWDRQLTDQDGPYIELMCGAYTDNQPDFSWIQPGEEKSFTQIFMPYQKIGPACNANREAALHLHVENEQAVLGVYVSSPSLVTIELECAGRKLYSWAAGLEPERPFVKTAALPAGTRPQDLTLRVVQAGELMLEYRPSPQGASDIPSPALPALPPEQIGSMEELFLNGLHLEQYRHATYAPEPYYLEGLRRDPGDSRCNQAMGLLLYRRGCFTEAEGYFRAALRRLTLRNPNPYDGEASYYLGLSLLMQGRFVEAENAFYKAVWNAAVQDGAYYELACLASRQGHYAEAISRLENCLDRNQRHYKARHLKTALLRLTGQTQQAVDLAKQTLGLDALEYGSLWELAVLQRDGCFELVVGADAEVRIPIALDYARAGLWSEAIILLDGADPQHALAAYTLAWLHEQASQMELARKIYGRASALPPDYSFPNRLEEVLILGAACRVQPQDARAFYYLGNFWYAHRRYEQAVSAWETACRLDPTFPTVQRNLGLAYFNKRKQPLEALAAYQRAFELNPADAKVFFEYDQLLKRLNKAPEERLALLEGCFSLVQQRDDLTIEYILLLNLLGRVEQAFDILMKRSFHPWEGGEGKVTGQYKVCLVEKAKRYLVEGQNRLAVSVLEQAQVYPENLGEGKLAGAQENQIFYYLGCAFEALGDSVQARNYFERAAQGLSEPVSALYYNDQPPDTIFYQGLAQKKLGQTEQARSTFSKLVSFGETHLHDRVKMDYFAVSLPDFMVFDVDLDERNRLHCHYMIGLGALGLGELEKARQHFEAALVLDRYHLGASLHLKLAVEGK
jgi:tetratricopeptide (TPR) repeat protein